MTLCKRALKHYVSMPAESGWTSWYRSTNSFGLLLRSTLRASNGSPSSSSVSQVRCAYGQLRPRLAVSVRGARCSKTHLINT